MHVFLLDADEEKAVASCPSLQLAEGMSRVQGVQATLVCRNGSRLHEQAQASGVPVLALPSLSPWSLRTVLGLGSALRAGEDTILLVCSSAGLRLARLLRRLYRRHFRLVLTYALPASPSLRLAPFACADGVVCPSSAGVASLRGAGLAEVAGGGRLRVILPAPSGAAFERRKVRNDDRFVFVVPGPLVEATGHGTLFEAMRTLMEDATLPPWEVRLVGGGPLFSHLLDEAQALGVAARLAMLGTQDERVMLPQCDCLVVPARSGEAGADAVRAAWSVGLPLIASSIEAHAELVDDGVSGLLVPEGDAAALAAAMLRVMTERAVGERLVQGGDAKLACFTSESVGQQYVALFREALSAKDAQAV